MANKSKWLSLLAGFLNALGRRKQTDRERAEKMEMYQMQQAGEESRWKSRQDYERSLQEQDPYRKGLLEEMKQRIETKTPEALKAARAQELEDYKSKAEMSAQIHQKYNPPQARERVPSKWEQEMEIENAPEIEDLYGEVSDWWRKAPSSEKNQEKFWQHVDDVIRLNPDISKKHGGPATVRRALIRKTQPFMKSGGAVQDDYGIFGGVR